MNSINTATVIAILIFSDHVLVGLCADGYTKKGLSGITRIFDDRNSQLDTLGDPHGGLPDDATSLVKFCAQFVYSGLFIVIFTTVRYPLKILIKAIMAVGALGFIKSNAMYCVNPITVADYTSKARLVNAHNDRLVEIRQEWTKRAMNILRKVPQDQMQKMACCAFHEFKRKTIEEVPEATEFLKGYFRGYYKLCEIVFCQQYQEGSSGCDNVVQIDEEPDAAVPRSWYTPMFDIFNKFM